MILEMIPLYVYSTERDGLFTLEKFSVTCVFAFMESHLVTALPQFRFQKLRSLSGLV